MGLAESIKKTLTENQEKAVKNTFEEKIRNMTSEAKPMELLKDNKKFQMVVAKYKEMAKKEHWDRFFNEINLRYADVERNSDYTEKLNKMVMLVTEKIEVSYNTYEYIVQNPLSMDEKLKELSSKIKKIDKELDMLGLEQISFF